MKSPALLTDLYQLTMGQAYFDLDMHATAVFELFVRKLPNSRNFLVSAGLEQIGDFVESLRFTAEDLEFLASLGLFRSGFLQHLESLRFTGSMHALPEGTPFFADEPILRITAPILEAQLLESRLLNIAHFQTLIASKAARCVIAADGRRLVDFGFRRAHEADAGVFAARAAFIAGFGATATVESGRRFGIPLAGTLAHSFIETHDSEDAAFRNFLASSAAPTTLLVDTYDTARAVQRVVAIEAERASAGSPPGVGAIRIDSGDLAASAKLARNILDAGGCEHVKIVVSGGLEEKSIEALVDAGVPVDVFGVGTSLDASTDAPTLDMVYKLVEYAGKPRRKRSVGKATWPGAKQVLRQRDASGRTVRDLVCLADETGEGEPLLSEVMRSGARIAPRPSLPEIQRYCRREVASLPEERRRLAEQSAAFPVLISEAVRGLAVAVDAASREEAHGAAVGGS